MQLSELREYAARRGWGIFDEYVDQGVSGSKESRPQLNRLTADAHRRAFDAVLAWKIDRYGRSLKHLVNALADLSAYGVAFISFRDNLDLSTPSGRLMFQIIGAMAEFERSAEANFRCPARNPSQDHEAEPAADRAENQLLTPRAARLAPVTGTRYSDVSCQMIRCRA